MEFCNPEFVRPALAQTMHRFSQVTPSDQPYSRDNLPLDADTYHSDGYSGGGSGPANRHLACET